MPMQQIAHTSPFEKSAQNKSDRLLEELNELTSWHARRCEPYRRILDAAYGGKTRFESLVDLPMLPVRLFKSVDLVSVAAGDVTKILTSSGTMSQVPSRIFLDKATASAQARALINIMRDVIGSKRLPMAILDSPIALNRTNIFSARGAGILGFSQFGYDHTYLLDNAMQLNEDATMQFIVRHASERKLLFGFTFIIWQYVYSRIVHRQLDIDFGDSILIHGGGWKKLADQQVSNQEFKERMGEIGIRQVVNYYGMVEQTGSIFVECEKGYFHAPCYADVLARDTRTLEPLSFGSVGILELMSNIPRSYPGHVLLTEDLGTVLGEDDCPCRRKGKYFLVEGRLPLAELRGCGDTRHVEN